MTERPPPAPPPAPAPPRPPAGESDALVRRTRYTLRTLVLLLAATSALVCALILGGTWGTRFDLTATREHTLSPRTVNVLRGLDEPTAIVVSADVSKVAPRSWERVTGLLEEFARQSPNARVTVIDSGRPGAAERAAAVVGDLAERDRATIERHGAALEKLEAVLEKSATELARFASAVTDRAPGAADSVARERLLQAAASLRVASKDAADAAPQVRSARESGPEAATPSGTLRLIETDRAVRAAAPPITAAIKVLSDEAGAGLASILGPDAARLRDALAVVGDEMKSLRPVDALTFHRALQERPVVLVYNSTGSTSVDFDALFPRGGSGQTSVNTPIFAGEELLGAAMVSLRVQGRPVLVLVHAERERLLDEAGRPTASASNAIGKLLDRLALRGVAVAEWPVAVEPARPSIVRLDPSNQRPKVWFVMPAPARTSADPRRGNPLADRTERIGRLGVALQSLLDAGDHVLLALEPSEMPAVGDPDPICAPLKAWGLVPDTARPLLERLGTPRGPAVSAYQTLRASAEGTVIGEALRGLSLILHWPMAIDITASASAGVRAEPVFSVQGSEREGKLPRVWGESSWLALRYANVRQPFQALMPPDLPAPDAGRDRLDGPFHVVVSAERDRPGAIGSGSEAVPQRLLVVGAPGWFEDLYTQAAGTIDGRRVWAFPGNGELFEAGLHWLAGLDELIAGSPRIRDVPRIEPMSDARLSALRWVLIAGFPLGVLALGFAVRVLRG